MSDVRYAPTEVVDIFATEMERLRDEEITHIVCCRNDDMFLCGGIDPDAEWVSGGIDCNDCEIAEKHGLCFFGGRCNR